MTALDMDLVRRWVRLNAEKLRLEADLKDVKKELADVEQQVLDEYAETGTQRLTVDGTTVYQSRKLWASKRDDVPADDLAAALDEVGQGHLVTRNSVNGQTLSAWVRELEEAGDPIPPEVERLVKVSETYRLGFRRAG